MNINLQDGKHYDRTKAIPESFSRVNSVAATKKTMEIATQKCCTQHANISKL